MSEVKRYVTTCDCMSEASWGDYVRHADYDALAVECERLNKFADEANAQMLEAFAERDAALAELAALKGGQEAVYWQVRNHDDQYGWSQWEFIKPTNSYFGQTVETMLADYRAYIERGYKYELRALYTAPPAQASAWVPEGWKLVIRDLLWAGHARPLCQDGLIERCCCWRCVSKRADAMLAAQTPGDSDGKEGEPAREQGEDSAGDYL